MLKLFLPPSHRDAFILLSRTVCFITKPSVIARPAQAPTTSHRRRRDPIFHRRPSQRSNCCLQQLGVLTWQGPQRHR